MCLAMNKKTKNHSTMKWSVFVYFIIASNLHLFIVWHAEDKWEIEWEGGREEEEWIYSACRTYVFTSISKLYFHFGIFKSYYYKIVLLLCLFFKTLHILGYWICSMIYMYVCECLSGMLFRFFFCVGCLCHWWRSTTHTDTRIRFLWKQWRTIYGLRNNIIISSWVFSFFRNRTLGVYSFHSAFTPIATCISTEKSKGKKRKTQLTWNDAYWCFWVCKCVCVYVERLVDSIILIFNILIFAEKENNCWIISYLPGSYNLINCTFFSSTQ